MMAMGSFNRQGASAQTMFEINMVPLIDIMLVLLVIFIITAPLLAHSIRIELPPVSAEQLQAAPQTVDLAIDASGAVFWDEQGVRLAELPNRFAALAVNSPQAELRIRADLNTRYETVAQVLAAARRAGLSRIGFVTSPAS